ncbi:MAG: hypothetical protein ABEJ58_07700 [Halodesulfurarchaeum sp.]
MSAENVRARNVVQWTGTQTEKEADTHENPHENVIGEGSVGGHMKCPRCGDSLTVLTLDGHEAVVCESCEYVGVPTDHRTPERREGESWDEALERFRSER